MNEEARQLFVEFLLELKKYGLIKIERKFEIAEKRKRSKKWGDTGDKYEKTPKRTRRKKKIK